MVEKILLWLDAGFIQFGIAKFLQNIVDAEFFAIIDTNEGKEFFKNQKFIGFRIIWFYRDCFTQNKKTNLAALDAANGYYFLFKKSKGKIISLIDRDDFFHKDKIIQVSNFFMSNIKSYC